MPERLGVNYRLEIEVLTPLHIGNGVKLKQDFDFAIDSALIYRLNEDLILDDRWPEDPTHQEILLNQPLAKLLEPGDYKKHPEYFRYTLRGQPTMREIYEAIKDVQGRPYIPGSTLKGGLRTALLCYQTRRRMFQRGDFGNAGGSSAAKRAGQWLERGELGMNPNLDVLRALQIGDSNPVSTTALTLQKVQMVPGLSLDVEAVARGTRLTAALRVDTWLLEQRGQRGISWSEELTKGLRLIGQVAQYNARRRLKHEFDYHERRHDDEAATTFYGQWLEKVMAEDWPKDEFLIQVGFATGWRAKTVLSNIGNDDPLLERLVHDFSMDRGGGRKSRGYTRGEAFPKARHLAYVGDKPALPLGWLRVRMVKLS